MTTTGGSPTWDLVQAERRALVEDLAALEEPLWEHASLCPGWTVHDVAAHLVDNARTTTPRLLLAMARARFDFDAQNAAGVARERGDTPRETLARLRAVVTRTSGPPAPRASRLVEEVVHGEDIRRPLGLEHAYVQEAVERALTYQLATAVGLGGARERVAGLTVRATDAGIASGSGPVVEGPALDLLLVVSGRVVPGVLRGPGLAELEARAAAG
ncbi:maleylpyruvate isomerase family mycothiol-dependent enzyme [Serinicoccus kebangsaanensis]|uniref:maleylpyruvate isomerase family mycothiol-dependent enzyme n=1 Tax=Serinicoccus kebangsaanensis TaxID=2602069 RepID=UPI00124DB143|nr:maleylpyruvate isomerase family mycothiol-dependent enzyme [Serinicoccus kebangsaanensis]